STNLPARAFSAIYNKETEHESGAGNPILGPHSRAGIEACFIVRDHKGTGTGVRLFRGRAGPARRSYPIDARRGAPHRLEHREATEIRRRRALRSVFGS